VHLLFFFISFFSTLPPPFHLILRPCLVHPHSFPSHHRTNQPPISSIRSFIHAHKHPPSIHRTDINHKHSIPISNSASHRTIHSHAHSSTSSSIHPSICPFPFPCLTTSPRPPFYVSPLLHPVPLHVRSGLLIDICNFPPSPRNSTHNSCSIPTHRSQSQSFPL